jgi:hypothetical protein
MSIVDLLFYCVVGFIIAGIIIKVCEGIAGAFKSTPPRR